jgi:hypothetical protein
MNNQGIQGMEELHQMPTLATQKPSEMLAETRCELLPQETGKQCLFNCFFLNKLPIELHILLSEVDFAAHNSKLAHDVGAVMATLSF